MQQVIDLDEVFEYYRIWIIGQIVAIIKDNSIKFSTITSKIVNKGIGLKDVLYYIENNTGFQNKILENLEQYPQDVRKFLLNGFIYRLKRHLGVPMKKIIID